MGAATGAGGATDVSGPSSVPSITIGFPQRLHCMRTFRPRTLASGIANFAGQWLHETFMMRAREGRAMRGRRLESGVFADRNYSQLDRT